MLDQAVNEFAERVRDTDNFTQTTAHWLGCAVTYRLQSQEHGTVRPRDVLTLDVPLRTEVLYRRGFLWAPLSENTPGAGTALPEPVIVADVRSVVLPGLLSTSAEAALARGDTPLGSVFAPRPVRRHTHSVTRTSVVDGLGRRALLIRATLTVSGRPVATVEEIAYQRVLENVRAGTGPDGGPVPPPHGHDHSIST